MKHLRPWRLATDDGEATGLLTGYFEPQLVASRTRQGAAGALHQARFDVGELGLHGADGRATQDGCWT